MRIFSERQQPFGVGISQLGFSAQVCQAERHKCDIQSRTDGGDANEQNYFKDKNNGFHNHIQYTVPSPLSQRAFAIFLQIC